MGMSVEPWMLAWPRRARMPPPGRPMLPSSSWMMAAVRMYWTPDGVLGPAHRVAEGRRALPARVGAQRLGHLEELVLGDAAHLLDQLGRVAGEVALEQLEDAAGVLQGGVGLPCGLPRRGRRAVGLAAAGRRLLGGRPRAGGHALVLPGRRCRRTGSRGPSPRTGRRGPRCRGSPRRRSRTRWCRRPRTPGSRGRC